VLLGDYDNDGDLDVFVINEGSQNRLYANGGGSNHWMQVGVRGVESNTDGIGTRLRLFTDGQLQHREVNGTAGLSFGTRISHFGLGSVETVDSLQVRWPSGLVEVFKDPPVDSRLALVEGVRLTAVEAAGPEPEQSADNVVRDYRAELPAAVDAAFREQWAELEALQREVGVPMYVVIAPYALQVNEEPGLTGLQDYVAALCVASNLRCLDPLELFVANAESELFTPGSSYHFSTIGHALLSDWLVPRLTATPEQP